MKPRIADYPIAQLFLDRWSPRAMSGEPITHQELLQLLEAARWAPSSYNNQPWRFIYAYRQTQFWDVFLNVLVLANQVWAKNAAALILVASHCFFEFNGKPSRTHSFDAGAAWENLALQGASMGLVVHALEGFDYDRAHSIIQAPKEYAIEAMIAVGRPGNLTQLPPELQEREFPSERKPLHELMFEGMFQKEHV